MSSESDFSDKVNVMLSEILQHGEFGPRDLLVVTWLGVTFFLALYMTYALVVTWLFEWANSAIKFSLHIRRTSHPLCAECAGKAVRTFWQTYDFSFHTPVGEPTRIRFYNTFWDDNREPWEEDVPYVNSVDIHDCGGIDDVLYEVCSERGAAKFLCLPTADYASIMLEELEGHYVDSTKMPDISWMSPRTLYVAWGRVVLGEGDTELPPAFCQSRTESPTSRRDRAVVS